MGKNNKNNFNGKTNFNGPTQIVAGNVINNVDNTYKEKVNYNPVPVWRSPITMAMLSWLSVAIGILGVFPIGKILKGGVDFFKSQDLTSPLKIQSYIIMFMFLIFLFVIFVSLRRIVKNQTRHPLLFNFAISGYDRRLTLEKIHIDKCPKCGGKMKYYNKPAEWVTRHFNDGRTKREVTKRVPVIECKRNETHSYRVDPAEDKI
ncbi:hypothetical protein [Solibacillus sp. FSL K6-1523]|uniref:hypothetical protein n=1 Tax=Solibacillus sp. FSL K6-1523 TaxID=2921471 RepID=UPI0030F4D2A9